MPVIAILAMKYILIVGLNYELLVESRILKYLGRYLVTTLFGKMVGIKIRPGDKDSEPGNPRNFLCLLSCPKKLPFSLSFNSMIAYTAFTCDDSICSLHKLGYV